MEKEQLPQQDSQKPIDDLDASFDDPLQQRSSVLSQQQRLPLLLAVVGLLMVAIYFFWFAPEAGDKMINPDETQLEVRIAYLEQQMAKIDDLLERLNRIEQLGQQIEVAVNRLDRFEAATTNRLADLTRELKALSRPDAKPAGPDKQRPSDTSKAASSAKTDHHVVNAGETLFQISRRYGIDVAALRKANNLTESATIYPGQKLSIPPANP